MTVCLVGAGQWGRNHLRTLREQGVLAGVCDPGAAPELKVAHPDLVFYDNLDAVAAAQHIAACVVATPALTHVPVVERLLKAGKHVLVEKPLATTGAAAQGLARLAQQQKLVLMAGHLTRFHGAFERLLEIASAGELGNLRYIASHRLGRGIVRTEEDIFLSFAPHDLSMLLALAGALPNSVRATQIAYSGSGPADLGTIHLSFLKDLEAHVFVHWLHPSKEQRLVVVGTKQAIVFDDCEPEDKLRIYEQAVVFREGQCIPPSREGRSIPYDKTEPLTREIQHFLACIASGQTPITGAADFIPVSQVIEATRSAAASGLTATLGGRDYYSVHSTACIDVGAQLGERTTVWHFAHVMPGARIGERCSLGQNVFISGSARIGNGVKIQNNVSIYDGCVIEDDVFIGPSAVFTNVLTPRSFVSRRGEYAKTRVGKGASIGANATIVCGHDIGEYAMIGAGAVVTSNIPAYALVYGNPARFHGWVCRCGDVLYLENANASCARCGEKYEQRGDALYSLSTNQSRQ